MSYHSASFGWIYCIIHPREPEHIKIGMTTRSVESRLRTANTFSTQSFQIAQAKYIQRPFQTEQLLHEIFEPYRVMSNREFFRADCLPNVMAAFQLVPGVVHPESKYFSTRTDFTVHFQEPGEDSFEHLFFEHFEETGKLSDRVRLHTIRDALVANGLSEDVDVVEELMRLSIFPERDFYVGVTSKVLQSIESFGYSP
jgi:hypothetical protein